MGQAILPGPQAFWAALERVPPSSPQTGSASKTKTKTRQNNQPSGALKSRSRTRVEVSTMRLGFSPAVMRFVVRMRQMSI